MKLLSTFVAMFLVGTLVFAETENTDANQAPEIKEAGVYILSCNESVTGSELQVRVESYYTRAYFKNASVGGVTKRIIQIRLNDEVARSKLVREIPKDVTWENVNSYFLNDKYTDADTEYDFEPTFTDTNGRQFPAQLLRLKAAIPVENRKANEFGSKVSHFSINIILPESRAQEGRTFEASGYLDYSSQSENGQIVDGLTIGLGVMNCAYTAIKS